MENNIIFSYLYFKNSQTLSTLLCLADKKARKLKDYDEFLTANLIFHFVWINIFTAIDSHRVMWVDHEMLMFDKLFIAWSVAGQNKANALFEFGPRACCACTDVIGFCRAVNLESCTMSVWLCPRPSNTLSSV